MKLLESHAGRKNIQVDFNKLKYQNITEKLIYIHYNSKMQLRQMHYTHNYTFQIISFKLAEKKITIRTYNNLKDVIAKVSLYTQCCNYGWKVEWKEKMHIHQFI